MLKSKGHEKLSLTITLLVVCILATLGGLIYLYSDFINLNPLQISNIVKISREPIPKTIPNETTKITKKDVNRFPENLQDNLNARTEFTPDSVGDKKNQEFHESSSSIDKDFKNIEGQNSHLVHIFFVKVTDSGHMSLKQLSKNIQGNLPHMNAALKILLDGPSNTDLGHGLHSLIPKGSQLLSVSIKDGIAYLNFNEQFMFNTLGTDGYHAQLQQIVYTATEIPTVEAVQITVEGKKIEFLYEGVYIGNPLSRTHFTQSHLLLGGIQ